MRWSVLAGAVVLGGCAGVQLPQASLTDPGALMFNGYTNPKVNCWRCHNGDATGAGRGPGLAGRVRKKSDERLTQVIKEGDGSMPAFGKRLSDEEVTQLVSWLRATFPKEE